MKNLKTVAEKNPIPNDHKTARESLKFQSFQLVLKLHVIKLFSGVRCSCHETSVSILPMRETHNEREITLIVQYVVKSVT